MSIKNFVLIPGAVAIRTTMTTTSAKITNCTFSRLEMYPSLHRAIGIRQTASQQASSSIF